MKYFPGASAIDIFRSLKDVFVDESILEPLVKGISSEYHPRFGTHHTEESKKLMGEKISLLQTGRKRKPFTDEHKAKMASAKLGKKRKPFSEETRKRMSESKRKQYLKGEK